MLLKIPNCRYILNMKIIYSFFLSFLSIINISSQTKDKFVAIAGNEKISAHEYQMRYEFMPHLDNDPFLKDSVKYHFIYTLIAEKLWAQEAEELGLDTTEYMTNTMQPIENLYLRDALFKEEVENKVKINPQDIFRANSRINITLKFNAISSVDSSEIASIYQELKNGASFDSLLRERSEFSTQQNSLEGSFGQFDDEAVEDTLYNLRAGNYSSPVKTKYGWFIFKLNNKIKKTNNDESQSANAVLRILKEREAKKLGTEYLENLLSGTQARIDSSLFFNIANKFYLILTNKVNTGNYSDTSTIFIDAPDIFRMAKEFGSDTLNMNLVYGNEISITVKDFLYNSLIDMFYIKSPNKQNVEFLLNRTVKSLIQENILDKEAIKKGLHDSPDVKNAVNMWEENHLAQMLKNKFRDSVHVTDTEVNQYIFKNYENDAPVTEVNILEILNDKLEVMEYILEQLKYGADFRELAKLYTKREWTKDKGGEFGYFPITMYGEIGRTAGKMKIGEVYGPISTPDGYSIFELIGKKEIDSVSETTLKHYKEIAKSDLEEKKLDTLLTNYTIKLANKFGVKINRQTVNSLKLTDINMFTFRYMGFGGRIAAVPFTSSFYDWMYKWRKIKSVLP